MLGTMPGALNAPLYATTLAGCCSPCVNEETEAPRINNRDEDS